MRGKMQKDADEHSALETEKRREAALKRMLATPPTRHADSKMGRKPKAIARPIKPESV
jgi:hypothetical protein